MLYIKFLEYNPPMFCVLIVMINFSLISTKTTEKAILGPKHTKVLINGTVRLRCRVLLRKGFDQIKVQWRKDKFGYENETLWSFSKGRYVMPGSRETGNYDLVIRSVTEEDDGEYACQVNAIVHSNPNQSRLETSKSINLTVIVPPKNLTVIMLNSDKDSAFKSSKNNIVLAEEEVVWGKVGQYILLACVVKKSRPAAELRWKLGKVDVFQDNLNNVGSIVSKTEYLDDEDPYYNRTETKLRLRLRRDHNGKRLKCVLSNHQEFLSQKLRPKSVIINVLYASGVKIAVSPHRAYFQFTEHEIITFTCSASVNPSNASYIWLRYDPQTSKTVLERIGSANGVIQLRLQRDMNEKFLRCLVVTTLQPWDKLCYKIGGNNPFSLIQPGQEVPSKLADMLTNCSLPKKSVYQIKIKTYSSYLFTSAYNQIPLRISYAPLILDSVLETKAAFLGDVVHLVCHADSNPPSRIAWYKSRLSIREVMTHKKLGVSNVNKNKKSLSASVSSMKLVSMSSNYHFTVTHPDKLGLYICLARTNGFPPVQKSVFVGQGAAPKIFNKHTKIAVDIGSSVRIPCIIVSIPLPSKEDIVWRKKSDELKLNPKDQIYIENRLAGLVSYLYLHKVQQNDYGVYNCSVSNMYGSATLSLELSPPARPPIIFIIGSTCAILLAIVFAFIVFCIIKSSRIHNDTLRSRPSYTKGNFLDHQNNSILDQENRTVLARAEAMHYANMYHDHNNFTPGNQPNNFAISPNSADLIPMYPKATPMNDNVDPPYGIIRPASRQYYHISQINAAKDEKSEMNLISGPIDESVSQTQLGECWIHTGGPIQSTGEWMDTPATPPGFANESSRSYDSGVGPDESNLTASSPKQQPQSLIKIGCTSPTTQWKDAAAVPMSSGAITTTTTTNNSNTEMATNIYLNPSTHQYLLEQHHHQQQQQQLQQMQQYKSIHLQTGPPFNSVSIISSPTPSSASHLDGCQLATTQTSKIIPTNYATRPSSPVSPTYITTFRSTPSSPINNVSGKISNNNKLPDITESAIHYAVEPSTIPLVISYSPTSLTKRSIDCLTKETAKTTKL